MWRQAGRQQDDKRAGPRTGCAEAPGGAHRNCGGCAERSLAFSRRARYKCGAATTGGVPEWLIGTVSKTVVGATPPRVRIPAPPPHTPAECLFFPFSDRRPSPGLGSVCKRNQGQGKAILQRTVNCFSTLNNADQVRRFLMPTVVVFSAMHSFILFIREGIPCREYSRLNFSPF